MDHELLGQRLNFEVQICKGSHATADFVDQFPQIFSRFTGNGLKVEQSGNVLFNQNSFVLALVAKGFPQRGKGVLRRLDVTSFAILNRRLQVDQLFAFAETLVAFN